MSDSKDADSIRPEAEEPDEWLDETDDEDNSDINEPAEVQEAKKSVARTRTRYARLIEHIFAQRYKPNSTEVEFTREDITAAATSLQIKTPKNLGDVVYTFRYRKPLPDTIRQKAPDGKEWIIRGIGDGLYRFVIVKALDLTPNGSKAVIKVPNATPAIISHHRLNDEQSLLAQLRYNRLVDLFTSTTCYSLQNHLRTKVADVGQVETDEVYIGVNRVGAQFVFPVQAKGGSDKLGRVQVEQDLALCKAKFPSLVCRPIAAQFIREAVAPSALGHSETIVLFELREDGEEIVVLDEKHYRLVSPAELSPDELAVYRQQAGY